MKGMPPIAIRQTNPADTTPRVGKKHGHGSTIGDARVDRQAMPRLTAAAGIGAAALKMFTTSTSKMWTWASAAGKGVT